MTISNISVNSVSSIAEKSTAGNLASASVDRNQSSPSQQASATVTLSVQAQKLSQAHTQANLNPTTQPQGSQPQTSGSADNTVNHNAAPQSTASSAAPGIQFMTGERKTGRVNTFV